MNLRIQHRSFRPRDVLFPAFAAALVHAAAQSADSAQVSPSGQGTVAGSRPAGTYETHATGLRILPGQWRPHYPFEQIAWISPSWPSQDYLWLDFPEAIFSSQGLLFLSHVNPPFPVVFPNQPKVPWRGVTNGIAFERQLPNGVRFGGSVVRKNATAAGLELHLENGSPAPLTNLTLQTCLFLRAAREFADYTNANKFVHLPGAGWQSWPEAVKATNLTARYQLGWRGGKPLADWPVIVTLANTGQRLVAMTWFTDTLSLINNPRHPCMHADPRFKDLAPGERASIRGEIRFFEGTLDEFSAALERDEDFRGGANRP